MNHRSRWPSLCPPLLLVAALAILAGCGDPGGAPEAGDAVIAADDDVGPLRQLQVDDGYIYRPIPGTDMTAGYFEIINHSPEPVTLIGASSDVAARVELHTHRHDDDMVRMRPLGELELPTGEPVSFAPGGHHLMLFGVDDTLASSVDVTLVFDSGLALTVPFQVRSR